MTVWQLIDDGVPKLTNPTRSCSRIARASRRRTLEKSSTHRSDCLPSDRLLGAACRGHNTRYETALVGDSGILLKLSLVCLRRRSSNCVVMESNPCANVTKPKASTKLCAGSPMKATALLAAQCLGLAGPVCIRPFRLTTGARKGQIKALMGTG